ncbi:MULTISPECIES: ABC transporter permease [Lactococcus]|uniref:ABC transporter permease protein n=1 Tax=Lactococcus lactis subsp. cremoris TaxID=1359 RepID=A0A166KEW1_LACLC|nr:ABC transporter permease [Lactococcus cremoris]KZK08298.1 ABC transporter permease protein [Lactococcus cremoris]
MIRDIMTLTGRNMKRILRVGEALISILVIPIVMFLVNYYVFAGGEGAALANIYPFMAILCVLMGISYTGLRVYEDKKSNMFARVKSLPIHQSSLLWSHVMTTVICTLMSLASITGLAFLFGIESPANIGHWGLLVLGLLVFTAALSWIMILGGLIAKSTSAASAFFYMFMIFAFLTPGFMGPVALPDFLLPIANVQPVTIMVNGITELLVGGNIHLDLGLGFLWALVIFLGGYVISQRLYKEKIK